jgi:hypothetical protein
MREFFLGWRRKAGNTMRGTVVFFVAAWIRSYSFADSIPIKDGQSLHVVESVYGGVRWMRFIPSSHHPETYSSESIPFRWHVRDLTRNAIPRYMSTFHDTRCDMWTISYWVIVI